MKSNQFLFNKAARGLLKQMKKSTTKSGASCLYRGADDTRCGVGMVLPNSCYVPGMEGRGASVLFEDFPKLMDKAGISPGSYRLLEAVQAVHDQNQPKDWLAQLKAVAVDFDLTMPRI